MARPPRNKGEHYPADPPTVEEIVAVVRIVGDRADGQRLRALVVLLWRAGLRISEALALAESDLGVARGAVLVRHGKGGKRREVGMDRWAWKQLEPCFETRRRLPIGALLCVMNLGITSVYMQGIDSSEIIETVHRRPSPVISASAGLQASR